MRARGLRARSRSATFRGVAGCAVRAHRGCTAPRRARSSRLQARRRGRSRSAPFPRRCPLARAGEGAHAASGRSGGIVVASSANKPARVSVRAPRWGLAGSECPCPSELRRRPPAKLAQGNSSSGQRVAPPVAMTPLPERASSRVSVSRGGGSGPSRSSQCVFQLWTTASMVAVPATAEDRSTARRRSARAEPRRSRSTRRSSAALLRGRPRQHRVRARGRRCARGSRASSCSSECVRRAGRSSSPGAPRSRAGDRGGTSGRAGRRARSRSGPPGSFIDSGRCARRSMTTRTGLPAALLAGRAARSTLAQVALATGAEQSAH